MDATISIPMPSVGRGLTADSMRFLQLLERARSEGRAVAAAPPVKIGRYGIAIDIVLRQMDPDDAPPS
jgi:hypothetical protein